MTFFGLDVPRWLTLRNAVNHLENAIITLSGPAIAISGIIAGIDLLTGGTMFKDTAWLSLTWAICLLLTLDFQVLMLGARARRVYLGHKDGRRKCWEIVAIIVIAAAISSVSVQMQSIIARSQATVSYTDARGLVHSRSLTIEEATRQMGIDPVALIWERSALVLLLIFMSGWFRDEEHQQDEATNKTTTDLVAGMVAAQMPRLKADLVAEIKAAMPVPQPAPTIDYTALAHALAPLFEARVTTIIEELKATALPALDAPYAPSQDTATRGTDAEATQESQVPEPEPVDSDGGRAAKLEASYQEIKATIGGMRVSGRALAERAKVARGTATAWLKATHPENEAAPCALREPELMTEPRIIVAV